LRGQYDPTVEDAYSMQTEVDGVQYAIELVDVRFSLFSGRGGERRGADADERTLGCRQLDKKSTEDCGVRR
jgi:hypothetical protein